MIEYEGMLLIMLHKKKLEIS